MPYCGTLSQNFTMPKMVSGLIWAATMLFMLPPAFARDNGQWENQDPEIRAWYQSLKQPDRPLISCCGEADAYWADGVEIKNSQVVAIITDTRPDEPLGRPHIPVGTRIVVPPHKMKWDRGNPTGHIVIFIDYGGQVYCYVTGTGI